MKVIDGVVLYESLTEMNEALKNIQSVSVKVKNISDIKEVFKFTSFQKSDIGDIINIVNESGKLIGKCKCINYENKKIGQLKDVSKYIVGLNESAKNKMLDRELFINEVKLINTPDYLLNKSSDLYKTFINNSSVAYDIFDTKINISESFNNLMNLNEGIINYLSTKLGITHISKVDMKKYEAAVKPHLNDPYIYVVLTSSGSIVGNIIKNFTNDPFNHTSISFDSKMDTMMSMAIYNDEKSLRNVSGLRWEHPILSFNSGYKFEMYKIKVSKEQKLKLLEAIINLQKSGVQYNMDHLVLSAAFDLDGSYNFKNKDNALVCSEFVYLALQEIGVNLFSKTPGTVRPYDFVKLSPKTILEFEAEGNVYEWYFNKAHKEFMNGKTYYNPPQGIYKFKYVTSQIKDTVDKISDEVKQVLFNKKKYVLLPVLEK